MTEDFFRKQSTVHLAKDLLGCVLVHETPDGRIAGVICETEAYTERDEASHTFGGRRTKRNEVMFLGGGHLYVYFTYGMYHCLNIVSEKEGFGSAVLVRAVKPIEGFALARQNRQRLGTGKRTVCDRDIMNGPGKLCQAFAIEKRHNGVNLTDAESAVYVLGREDIPMSIQRTPRIGISKGTERLWRFVYTERS